MITPGRLFLFPVPISEEEGALHIPEFNLKQIRLISHFIVEDEKTARRNLKLFGHPDIPSVSLNLLNEHTKKEEIYELLKPLLQGKNTALMSDAGCPGIADPGAELINLAHKNGIDVIPFSGPSSVVLSIMASGFNSQNFAFCGYLPVEKTQRIRKIKELEKLAVNQKQAQFFIETPYRNEQIFEALLKNLAPQTKLFVGINLQTKNQFLKSSTVAEWLQLPKPELHKVPAVFGIFY